ncbi:MAG TPA: ABC transporter permease [Candidatus Eisenbacteria bacterium]|nr:ABC transporter permease [Candidatus Eisenbacteria bacterium]
MDGLRAALRELGRRRLRTTLTCAGIAIGVTALVLLGALSEKMDRLVRGGRDFATGQITVSGAGSGGATGGLTRGGLVSADQLAALQAVPGVEAVAPIVMFPVGDGPPPLPFTLAPLVFGIDVERLWMNRSTGPPRVAAGRLVPRPGADEVVIGSQVARSTGLAVGGTLTVRGRAFDVIGVLEPTFTGPDSFVFMPFPIAEQLLVESEPLLRRLALVPGSKVLPVATAAAAFWKDGEDPEAVAARVREQVSGVSVLSPADARLQVDRALVFLRALVLGSAIVALVVAALAVANTMVTAVVERRREIGLRRVVGATRGQVVRALVLEATAIGAAGGLLGAGTGMVVASALNAVTERLGAPIFLLTVRLLAGAIVLPAALAALAGLWPARRAVRLAPTDALRYV